MNKTTLDALLIDRALGALPLETEALLDAYLGKTPEVSAELDTTFDTVSLVREAFHEEKTVLLPEFHAPTRVRQRKLRRHSLQAVGMAATLAIGFFFGQYRMDSTPVSVSASGHAGLIAEPAPKATGIWSISPDRLRIKTRQPSSWRWNSPVQQPQFINKETRHES